MDDWASGSWEKTLRRWAEGPSVPHPSMTEVGLSTIKSWGREAIRDALC